MEVFKFTAKNIDGKTISGTVRGDTERDAVADLRKQNLVVISITKDKAKTVTTVVARPRRVRVKADLLTIFTRQLSTMLSAGIPILECIETLQEQQDHKGFKAVLGNVIENIRGGRDLSESIGEFPRIFSRIYVNMIKAGEASGQLDQVLTRLAEYLEASQQLKREIKAAMTYPVISLVLILGITIGLLVFIVPKFETIFVNLKVPLPGPTKVVLATSKFVQGNILFIIGGIVAAFFLLAAYKKTTAGERQIHWLMLRIPIFGPLFHKVCLSRFSKTFATLLQSGVPILGALEIVSATTGNRVMEDAVLAAMENIRQGETLGEPLARSGLFPPMVTRMITIGERTGALEQLLEKISEFYDQQVKASVETLTSMIEPIMIAIMGVLVGGMVLAIFLPILKIQEALRRK